MTGFPSASFRFLMVKAVFLMDTPDRVRYVNALKFQEGVICKEENVKWKLSLWMTTA